MRQIIITDREAGQRLDRFLEKYMQLAPKSFFYKMLRKKNIILNGKKAAGMERLSAGDEIKLFLSEETIDKFSERKAAKERSLRNRGSLDIVYEDEDVLVINKPQGMLSQKADKSDVSLVEYIAGYLDTEKGSGKKGTLPDGRPDTFRIGICNRLDRNTTGLVVAGKSVRGLQQMNQLFHDRTLQKYYLCIVCGRVAKGQRIDGYLRKNKRNNTVSVHTKPEEGAVRVITEYEPLCFGRMHQREYTLLRVHLITGKSHQIRAHLNSIGHSVIGDQKYGSREDNEIFRNRFHLRCQLLHAWELHLPERMKTDQRFALNERYAGQVWRAPVPKQFAAIMQEMGMNRVDMKRE